VKLWRGLAAATLLAAITSACAGTAATPTDASNSPPTGGTVTVTAEESGTSVTLHVGDLLVLALASFGDRPGLFRSTLVYPRDLLSLIRDGRQAPGYWRFSVTAKGTGTLRVTSLPCGPVLGPGAPAAGGTCPVTGGTGGTSPAPADAGMPARLFTITVIIG
jgi:hypothetical protein